MDKNEKDVVENSKAVKSWEKTVEWHFACEAIAQFKVLSPVDGEKEVADLIAKLGNATWILVEFKHRASNFRDENKKYPYYGSGGMFRFLKRYFYYADDFPSKGEDCEVDEYAKLIEDESSYKEILAGSISKLGGCIDSAEENKLPISHYNKVMSNLRYLEGLSEKGSGNPIGRIKVATLALLNKYSTMSSDDLGALNLYRKQVDIVSDKLPDYAPHYIVYGGARKGRQKLKLIQYWRYSKFKKDGNDLQGFVKIFTGKGSIFEEMKGVEIDKFYKYLDVLSQARGYIPDSPKDEGDVFGHLCAIGIFQDNGFISTASLEDFMATFKEISESKKISEGSPPVAANSDEKSEENPWGSTVLKRLKGLFNGIGGGGGGGSGGVPVPGG